VRVNGPSRANDVLLTTGHLPEGVYPRYRLALGEIVATHAGQATVASVSNRPTSKVPMGPGPPLIAG
jgi:hypothetical protein